MWHCPVSLEREVFTYIGNYEYAQGMSNYRLYDSNTPCKSSQRLLSDEIPSVYLLCNYICTHLSLLGMRTAQCRASWYRAAGTINAIWIIDIEQN